MAWTSTACTHTHMYRGANDGTPRRVLLDVVERVLRDVADARVRVLPDGARGGLDLAREALDESTFPGTVRADASHARRQRHLHSSLLDGDLVVARVLEGDVDDLDEGLALGFDACAENVTKPPENSPSGRVSDSSKFKFIFHADSPSIGPGFGKWNFNLFDFNSK